MEHPQAKGIGVATPAKKVFARNRWSHTDESIEAMKATHSELVEVQTSHEAEQARVSLAH